LRVIAHDADVGHWDSSDDRGEARAGSARAPLARHECSATENIYQLNFFSN
jgi:hypothetical protein